MSVEFRPARQEEMRDMGAIGAYVYGGSFGDTPDNTISESNRPEWTLCAFVDGTMASSFSVIPFTMRALGNAVAMGGISAVGTLPEYRRRGFVRRLMTGSFERMRERGQSVAALWASQAAIYQRYGFALTTVLRSYQVDTVDIAFVDGDNGSGEVSRVDMSEALARIKSVYIRHIDRRFGYLHRSSALWQLTVLEDRPEEGPIHVAVCQRDGEDVGYVVFTLRAGKVDHRARPQALRVRDLVALDTDAYRSLWSFLARHDLVGAVTWDNAPLDDPAQELMSEPRLLHASDREGAWFRVVDVAAALRERGYVGSGDLRIGIREDSLAPWNEGVTHLQVDGGQADAQAVSTDADITLSIKALTALYMGRHDAWTLRAWGQLEGDDGAVAAASALFATPHAPHAPDHF